MKVTLQALAVHCVGTWTDYETMGTDMPPLLLHRSKTPRFFESLSVCHHMMAVKEMFCSFCISVIILDLFFHLCLFVVVFCLFIGEAVAQDVAGRLLIR